MESGKSSYLSVSVQDTNSSGGSSYGLSPSTSATDSPSLPSTVSPPLSVTETPVEGGKFYGELDITENIMKSKVTPEKDIQLITALKEGKSSAVAHLIERGANVTTTDEFGNTVIQLAEQNNDSNMLKSLLIAVFNIYMEESRQLDEKQQIISLLSSGASRGVNALQLAVSINNVDLMQSLLSVKTDFNGKNVNGYTAIMLAAYFGKIEALNLLIKVGAELNELCNNKDSALMLAIGNGQIEASKLLIDAGADAYVAGYKGVTPLMLAVKLQKNDLARRMLKNMTRNIININNPNTYGDTALSYAVQSGNIRIIRDLINAGADVNAINIEGYTALMQIAGGCYNTDYYHGENDSDLIELLIYVGTRVDFVNQHGETALSLAADRDLSNDHTEENRRTMVKQLIQSGARKLDSGEKIDIIVDQLIAAGFGTLLSAIETNDYYAVKRHIASNAHKHRYIDGFTPLMMAAKTNHVYIVELLVNAKVNINQCDHNGNTALLIAAKHNADNSVNFLIKAGADVSIKNNNNESALNIARKNNYNDIAEKLRAARLERNKNRLTMELIERKGNLPLPEEIMKHISSFILP